MNDIQINKMLDAIGIPYAYHHFTNDYEHEDICPPFMIYVDEPPTILCADGYDYLKIRNVTFELYSDVKDELLLKKVRDVFISYEIRFKESEDWIEKEQMFEFAFFTQP